MSLSSGVTLRWWRCLSRPLSLHQRHLHRTSPLGRLPVARLVAPPTATPLSSISSHEPLRTSAMSPHSKEASCLHTMSPALRQARPPDPDFKIIYRFPYIMSVRLICRLKIYQTGLTLAAVPVMVLLQDLDAAAKVGAVGLFAAGMLYVMGEFFRRFVGLLYLHRDGTQLKIAHLTFWGGRRDIVIPVEDIVPFSELKDSPTDVYFKLRRYSGPETFYLSLRYGGISSMESLETVFGPLEER